MKTCDRCGNVDYKPKEKCPKCGDKYKGYQCDPLSSASRDWLGDYYYTSGDVNARHNKE